MKMWNDFGEQLIFVKNLNDPKEILSGPEEIES
jgi:hypothetical protein